MPIVKGSIMDGEGGLFLTQLDYDPDGIKILLQGNISLGILNS
jgi:hypothetical protein